MGNIKNLRGSIVAIVTPFNQDKSVDFTSLDKLIQFHLSNQTDGIVVCGTTGEAATLSEEEFAEVIRFTCEKVDHKIPVIAGSGTNNTMHAVQLSRIAEAQGADALLVVTPYYNKPNPNGMYQHYATITQSVEIPIFIYNVPGRTGINLSPTITKLLANDFSTIIGIKEAAGNPDQMMELIRILPDDFLIFSGDDSLAMSLVCMGAKGCVSVAANIFPKAFHDIMMHASAGELEAARKIHYQYLNLMNLNFVESNPIPVKTALHLMGYIHEEFRLPLAPISAENKEQIRNELQTLKLL